MATTTVETVPRISSFSRRTSQTTLPPDYSSIPDYELAEVTSSSSSSAALPDYEAAATASASPPGFKATRELQIQADGLRLMCVMPLCPPKAAPIQVLSVRADGRCGPAEYVSVRPQRYSGSCYLARADDPAQAPVCRTTYRFGPCRPPKIRLAAAVAMAAGDEKREGVDAGDGDGGEATGAEDITFNCKGALTRSTVMRTPLGTFEWRYAGRAERKAVGLGADSLLVMERVTKIALAGGKTETRRTKVAQLVRGKGLRTAGTGRSTAGNGGRLQLDLREWAAAAAAAEVGDDSGVAGSEVEQLEVLAVASCISMLKKEVDRRRSQHMMMMSGGGGGP